MPNDTMVNGQRLSNLFGTRDEDWHSMAIKPIRGLYNMTKALDVEVHVDRILELFAHVLEERFVKGSNGANPVDMAEYIPFCMVGPSIDFLF